MKIRFSSVVNTSQQRAMSFAYALPYPEIKKGLYVMMIILTYDEFFVGNHSAMYKASQLRYLEEWCHLNFFVVRHCLWFTLIKTKLAYAQMSKQYLW